MRARVESLPLVLLAVVHLALAASPPTLLVYSRTAGYRHESIPVAIDAIRTIATTTGLFTPTFSEDPLLFREASLKQFDVIAFLSNSDQVLDTEGEAAFQQWLTRGGGLVGLHSATACLFEFEAFGVAMGSWFDYHPTIQNATFTKLVSHPTIDMLPSAYTTYEEVYNFRSDPRSVNATVLLTVDSDSYTDPLIGTRPYYQGSPHPIAWYRDSSVDLGNGTSNGTMTGRMWMTSLGHTNDTWRSPLHLQHVQAGLQWVIEGVSNVTATSSTTSLTSTSLATSTSAQGASSSSASPTSSVASGPASREQPLDWRIAVMATLLGGAGIAALL